MKTTIKKIIQDKIFTKSNIKNLWSKIKSEYESSVKENPYSSLVMQINCDDWFSYESQMDGLIQDGDILDNKKCSQIRIDYRDTKLERYISFEISHGNSNYGNILTVTGDKNWVAGTFDSLNDIINSAKPQEHWFIKYQNQIHLFWVAVSFYLTTKIDYNLSRIKIHEIVWVYLAVMGLSYIIILLLINWVLKLWPSVEFDFGPEHKKIEKNRRYRLWIFFLVIIIPLLINLVTDLI